jgi:hypothetical protein
MIQDIVDASGPYHEYLVAESVKDTRSHIKFSLKVPCYIPLEQVRATLTNVLTGLTIFRIGLNWMVNIVINK